MNVTAIIPARGGSRGIRRKNAKLLAGKPLVAYSIESALNCRRINKVIVSSEDEDILSIASSYSDDIAWKRPDELSGDNANLGEVIHHVSNELALRNIRPDVTVVLLPTSPFRPPELMNFLVDKAVAGYSHVRTVREMNIKETNYCFYKDDQKLSKLRFPDQTFPLFRPYGLFSASNSSPTLPEYIHVIDDEIQLVDIDYPYQFQLAEELIRTGLFNFRI